MNKFLRFILGLLTGLMALLVYSMAPWTLAYQGFSWLSGYGLTFCAALAGGTLLMWAAARLIRPVISVTQAGPKSLPDKAS
jgi:hypothetical protein